MIDQRFTRGGAVLALWLAGAATADAELVFFSSGRSLSVRGHRFDGESLILLLREGGEIVCDRSLIERIVPDEVPYPEPAPPSTALGAAASSPYGDIIDRVAAEQGLAPALVRAVIQVESAYEPRARSRKGALGLMQLMPGTVRQYSVTDPFDPQANIEAGARHLKGLLARFDLSDALAAYNAGEAAVLRFGGIPPYRETRQYVSRVLTLLGLTDRASRRSPSAPWSRPAGFPSPRSK